MEDITKTGPVGLKGLNRLPSPYLLELQALSQLSNIKHGATSLKNALLPQESERNVGIRAAEAGYGNSIYDSAVANSSEFDNINDIRGQAQPWYAQIGAGLAKMGVLAATTFTDGVVGTLAGLVNLGAKAVNGEIHSASDAFYNFIDNPFSELMQQINESSEKWLPNYYTDYERDSPWYTLIFTANFLGDKFLKNLGFTIGAAAAAQLTAAGASKFLVKKGIRDAFKGVVVNSAGKELRTGAEIYKAYKAGDAFLDGAKLTSDLAKSAKKLKAAEAKLKVIGAVSAAAGEGRIEAISGSNEWEQGVTTELENSHKEFPMKALLELYDKHPEYFAIDELGNPHLVHPTGISQYNERLRSELENYELAKADIAKRKAFVANSIFGLNLAILSISNLWLFGRSIAGGYTTGRINRGLVKGTRKTGFDVDESAIWKTRARALSNPLVEANEEMSQAAAAEGSGLWQSSNINSLFGSFYGGKIDPIAEEKQQGWLSSVLEGISNTYGKVDRWEEGFIGGLTGLLGIPKIKVRTKENGKKGLSFSLEGELWLGLADAKQLKREAAELAEFLNKRVGQNEEFINYYQGMIRHNAYEDTMDGALEAGDEFTYKNAKHSLMVSDAIMFDRAGRLQDLYEMIDEALGTNSEDVKSIIEMTINKETGKSIHDGKTDEQIVEAVRELAKQMKETIENYAQISDDLKTLYGLRIDKDVLEELTWGMTQVDNWEKRVGLMSKDIREALLEKALVLKDRFGVDIEVILNNLSDFGDGGKKARGLMNEITKIINDKNLSILEGRDKITAAIKNAQNKERANNLALANKVRKIRKIFANRGERLEKQRKKALAAHTKLANEQGRIEGIREEELESYKANYARALRQTIERDLEVILQLREAHPSGALVYNESELLLRLELEKVESGADIYESFAPVLESIDRQLAQAEELFDEDKVRDKRFKRGYDPKTKLVYVGDESAGTSKAMSEAEAEARHETKEKNYNILFQLLDLKKSLEDPNNLLISPLERLKLSEKIDDLFKILAIRDNFIDTYLILSLMPELFLETIDEKNDEARAAYVEKQVKNLVELLKNIESLAELRAALEEAEDKELIPQILDKLKEDGSPEVKGIVESYELLENLKDTILGGETTGIVDSYNGDIETLKALIEAALEIQDILDTAESIEDAMSRIKDTMESVKDSNPALYDAYQYIMDKYEDLSKSRRSEKKDKDPDKKVKNKKKDEDKDEDRKSKPRRRGLADLEDDVPEDVESEEENNEDENENEGYRDFSDDDDDDDGPSAEKDDSSGKRDKSSDTSLISTLRNLSEEDLDEVIDGNFESLGENIPDSDADIIKKFAKLIKDRRATPNIHSGSTGTNSESDNIDDSKSSQSRHRSFVVTGYLIDPLKNRRKRLAVEYDSPTSNVLRSLGAYKFVDSGRLGRLLLNNPDLTVHYLSAPNVDGLGSHIVLAIKVSDTTEEAKPIHTITANDGEEYLVIGTLGYSPKDRMALSNYELIKAEMKKERRGVRTKAEYIVSNKFKNTISHIYSGRMVLSKEGGEVEERDLKEVLNGQEAHFGVDYGHGDFRTPTISGHVVAPNSNNPNPRSGSVWLMTLEADGRWYAKGVRVKRFNSSEYDIDSHRNTPVMRDLVEQLRILCDPSESDWNRYLAKESIYDILYFPDDAQFVFTGDIVSIKDANGKVIFNNVGEGLDIDDKIEAILKALQDNRLNLRFLVKTSLLTEDNRHTYIADLLNSDILSTNLAEVHNVNASFEVPLLDPKTGKPIHNTNREDLTGHKGRRGVNSTIHKVAVTVNGEKYQIDDDGNVTLGDQPITDLDIIDLVLFMNLISQKLVLPVEGTKNFYLGAYSDGEEFGVLNGVIKTGEELEELKEKYTLKEEKKKQEEKLKKVAKRAEKKDEVGGEEDDDFFSDAEEASIDDFDAAMNGRRASEEDNEDDSEEDPELELEEDDDEEEEEDRSKKPPTGRKGPAGRSLGDRLQPGGSSLGAKVSNFTNLVVKNIAAIKSMGMTVSEFRDKVKELGVDLNTINTQDDFLGLLDQINCHR